MNKRITSLCIAVLLAGGLIVAVNAAEVMNWLGAAPAVNLSNNGSVMDESNLAVGPANHTAVIWSDKQSPRSVFLAQSAGQDWITTTLAIVGNQQAWYPTIAYSGTEVIAAWVQGDIRADRSEPRAIMQRDANALNAQTIITPVFGNTEINLVIAPTGMHMIFAATTNSDTQKSPWDLYYTHRYFTATTWATPTIAITHAQVISTEIWNDHMTASILRPQLAVNADGKQLNIVWQQEHKETIQTIPSASTITTRTIWYVSGTWGTEQIHWGVPQQMSPPDQKLVLRPNIAVGSTGKVHIIWVEALQTMQYVNYLRLDTVEPMKITGEAMQMNDAQPTYAMASIDTHGNTLCVVWHGFYTGSKEEITMRCSQNEGTTWQPLINVSENSERLSLFPVVKINDTGQAHVVWTEFRLVSGGFPVPEDVYYRTGTAEVMQVFLPLVLRAR